MPKHLALALLSVCAFASAQSPASQTISSKTANLKHIDGYLPLDWDAKAGKLYLEIPRLDTAGSSPDMLYTHSLPYGTGSNDLGLDRGQISRGQLIHFQRTGPKVLMIEPNQQFRSTSNDPAEQLAVRQSLHGSDHRQQPVGVLQNVKIVFRLPSSVAVRLMCRRDAQPTVVLVG